MHISYYLFDVEKKFLEYEFGSPKLEENSEQPFYIKIKGWVGNFFESIDEAAKISNEWKELGHERIKKYKENEDIALEENLKKNIIYCFKKAVESEPENIQNGLSLAQAHFIIGNYSEARRLFQVILEKIKNQNIEQDLNTQKIKAHCLGLVAMCHEREEAYLQAYDFFNQAFLLDSRIDFEDGKHRIYNKINEMDLKSIEQCSLLIQHNPDQVQHYIELGLAYLNKHYQEKEKESKDEEVQENRTVKLIDAFYQKLEGIEKRDYEVKELSKAPLSE